MNMDDQPVEITRIWQLIHADIGYQVTETVQEPVYQHVWQPTLLMVNDRTCDLISAQFVEHVHD